MVVCRHGGNYSGIQSEAITTCEAEHAQNSQRIVQKRGFRVQRSSNEAGPQIVQPLTSQILHFFLLHVVKQAVNGQIPTICVLFRRADLYGGYPTVLGVFFGAQIGDINVVAHYTKSSSGQMLRLLWVFLHGSHPGHVYVVIVHFLGVLFHQIREILSCTVVHLSNFVERDLVRHCYYFLTYRVSIQHLEKTFFLFLRPMAMPTFLTTEMIQARDSHMSMY
jgi:hypothetical protein